MLSLSFVNGVVAPTVSQVTAMQRVCDESNDEHVDTFESRV